MSDDSPVSDDYELICQLKIEGRIPLLKYRSKKTGIHVFIAQVEGPLVYGFITLGNVYITVNFFIYIFRQQIIN